MALISGNKINYVFVSTAVRITDEHLQTLGSLLEIDKFRQVLLINISKEIFPYKQFATIEC